MLNTFDSIYYLVFTITLRYILFVSPFANWEHEGKQNDLLKNIVLESISLMNEILICLCLPRAMMYIYSSMLWNLSCRIHSFLKYYCGNDSFIYLHWILSYSFFQIFLWWLLVSLILNTEERPRPEIDMAWGYGSGWDHQDSMEQKKSWR